MSKRRGYVSKVGSGPRNTLFVHPDEHHYNRAGSDGYSFDESKEPEDYEEAEVHTGEARERPEREIMPPDPAETRKAMSDRYAMLDTREVAGLSDAELSDLALAHQEEREDGFEL